VRSEVVGRDFDPVDISKAVLARWTWILLAAILGGLVGTLLSLFRAPKYQAEAAIGAGFDYGRVEFLDDDAERRIFFRIQDLLLSDETLSAALQELPGDLFSQVPLETADELRARVSLTRIEARWNLKATDASPGRAAAIANAWGESAPEAVGEAQRHAWKAAELQAVYFRVWCRPTELNSLGREFMWVCDESLPQASPPTLTEDLLAEVQLSRGIPPIVWVAWLRRAELPTSPVTALRALLALGGMAAGLILGLLATLGIPASGAERVQQAPSPPNLYSVLLSHWPRVFVLAVLGGLLGLGASWVSPARYLATAKISVGIDYSRTQFQDEDAERHILARVQDLLLSDEVLERAMDRAGEAAPSLGGFREQIRLTRIESEWSLAVTDPSPGRAAGLANAWAAASLGVLENAQREAWRLAELQALFFQFACRPQAPGEAGEPAVWVCDELEGEPPRPDLEAEILQRMAASYGIPPVISFALLESASEPEHAVTTPRAVLGLTGMILGLIPGAVWALRGGGNPSRTPDHSR